MKSKLPFALLLMCLLMIVACEDIGILFKESRSSEQWQLVTSNCRAHHDEGSAAHCTWTYDIYKFKLSPLRVRPIGNDSYEYDCPDNNCGILSQNKYSGFFIRTRGNFEQGPPNILFSETKIKAIGFTQTVLTNPNVLVCGHPLKEPWHPVGIVGSSAFLFFQNVPGIFQIIVLELAYIDKDKKGVFSLTFRRV